MDSGDKDKRQADLDWLYGGTQPAADRTRQFDEAEVRDLDRRTRDRAGRGGAGPADAARGSRPTGRAGQPAQRVVHTEDDLAEDPAQAPWRREEMAAAAPPSARTPRDERTSQASRHEGPAAPGAAQRLGAGAASLGAGAAALGARLGRRGASTARRGGRRNWKRIVLALLVAWLVWLLVVPMVATSKSKTIDDQPSGDRPANQPGTLTLLVGSDSREGLTAAEEKALGTGSTASAEGGRTDTMMLLYAPPSGKKVLISLPRDSYVTIPGHGKNKLNAAYALGGAKLLVNTIENDTGLRIDHYAEVGFDGFANIVDAVGGAPVCLSTAMVDKDSHTNLPAGCQTLTGAQALGYVRMRKADPTGDIGRTKRQRQMIGIIAKKAESPWTFINPVRYWKLNMAGFGAVKRGTDTSITDLPGIAWDMVGVSNGGLTLVVPTSSTDTETSAGSSVIWDREKALAMFQQIAKGDTSNLEQYAK